MNRLQILKVQEDLLRFEQFDQDEAYKFGNYMVECAKEKNITIAISIRLNCGCIIFQSCPQGTNLLNQMWMERKFNTVKLMQRSSLATSFTWEAEGISAIEHGLKVDEYASCGGGFPIRIKDSDGVIGVIIASNLYHVLDHNFVVECLERYLGVKGVPLYRED